MIICHIDRNLCNMPPANCVLVKMHGPLNYCRLKILGLHRTIVYIRIVEKKLKKRRVKPSTSFKLAFHV